MTKEEFQTLLLEFFDLSGPKRRPPSSWFLSLQEWAESKFNACYEEEQRQ